MRTERYAPRGWKSAVLLLLVLGAEPAAGAVVISLRDLADPVPPGGIITYRLGVGRPAPPEPPPPTDPDAPFCFNPPPECRLLPVTCFNPPPECVGTSASGFVCHNSDNDGADCGEGDPLAPNPDLCRPRPVGKCNGGNHLGLPCHAPHGEITTECPGTDYICVRAENDGEYCGRSTPLPTTTSTTLEETTTTTTTTTTVPPGATTTTTLAPGTTTTTLPPGTVPEDSFCLQRVAGVCSHGPKAGLLCTGPHGLPDPDCAPPPPTTTTTLPPPLPSDIIVTLPIPAGTTFLDADNGGTSDGSTITWVIPPCGTPETGVCPTLLARVLVSPATPLCTVITNQATASDQDGTVMSGIARTTIAMVRLRTLRLAYPRASNRDRFVYSLVFTLEPGQMIDPANEALRVEMVNSQGTIVDLSLPPGALVAVSTRTFRYRGTPPGIRSAVIRQLFTSHYALRLRATKLMLPDLTDLNVTVRLTLGNDTISHPARLIARRGNRRFTAVKSATNCTPSSSSSATTTTSSTTTTTLFGVVAVAPDNCPGVDNPGQEDTDADGQGDACDACPAVAAENPRPLTVKKVVLVFPGGAGGGNDRVRRLVGTVRAAKALELGDGQDLRLTLSRSGFAGAPVFSASTRSSNGAWRRLAKPPSAWVFTAPPGGSFRNAAVRRLGRTGTLYRLKLRGAPGDLSGVPLRSDQKLRALVQIHDGSFAGSCFEQTLRCRGKKRTRQVCRP